MPQLLGKFPPLLDDRNLKFAKYLPPVLPTIPDKASWHTVKNAHEWGVDGNDRYGNCVIVTAAHILDCVRANESKLYDRIPDDTVIKVSNEMGAMAGYYILTRLKWWKNSGMFGSRIIGFCDVELDHTLIKAAIHIFGHVDIGLSMPIAWKGKTTWDTGRAWAYQSGTWGGHSVPILGYETINNKIFYFACSWGEIVTITEDAMNQYCDEIYTSILPDWYAFDQLTPSQFNLEQLQHDLTQID